MRLPLPGFVARLLSVRVTVTVPLALLLGLPTIGAPQVHQGGARPLSDVSAPVSENSTNVGAGSGSVRDGSVGSMHSGSVRGTSVGSVRSGPVSEASVGPVSGSGGLVSAPDVMSVGESSVGAVKKDLASPLGERISEPLHELGALQEQLRQIKPLPRTTTHPSAQASQIEAVPVLPAEALNPAALQQTPEESEPTEERNDAPAGEPAR
jgi:hypothetical protein